MSPSLQLESDLALHKMLENRDGLVAANREGLGIAV